jgi:methylenetetrahydrofolate reductase (NADPH)
MPTLKEKIASGKFVVTAEMPPPLSASAAAVIERVEPLRGLADAVNVTDAAGARVAMSSFAAAAIMVRAGIEPVLQTTVRDRNRIALAADLLGAAAQGVENILILHGDDPKVGDSPDAKPVYDLDSRSAMALARHMSDRGELPSGRRILPPPAFFIGCADSPLDPPAGWTPKTLEAKIAAGAQFAQTQFCFDPEITRRYFSALEAHCVTTRLKFLAGVGILASARQARFMRENLHGIVIPDAVVARLEGAADPKAEGLFIAAEMIGALRGIRGIAGIHLMAPAGPAKTIAAVIREAGLA